MKIQFGNISNSLGTRVLGGEIRSKIEEALSNNIFVTFDFEGVDLISHSFADECFGKLLLKWELDDLRSKSTFRNTNELIKKTVSFTLKERLVQLSESTVF